MKKRMIIHLFVTGMTASMLIGCGQKESVPAVSDVQVEETTEDTSEQTAVEETETSEQAEEASDDYEPPTQDLSWIPTGVVLQKSENTKDTEIENTIREYYEVPDEYLAETRYYYNAVDLNQNGVTDYFVVVLGSYVSGNGGASALWLDEDKQLLQAFQGINTPIIIEDQTENGCQTIVLQQSSGTDEVEYVRITNDGELYLQPDESEVITDLSNVTGTAIISNDIIQEFYDGTYLSLQ